MGASLEQIKAEHGRILIALDRVKALGVSCDCGRSNLYATRDLLLNHLEQERREVYPLLKRRAGRDEAMLLQLHRLEHALEAVTHKARRFFNNYAQGGSAAPFTRDFGLLYATIWQQMYKEEAMLDATRPQEHAQVT